MEQIRFDRPGIAKVYDVPISDQWLQNLVKAAGQEVCGRIRIALEVGCGPGSYTRNMAKGLGATTIGIDFSHEMIETAVGHRDDKSVHFAVANALMIPFQHNTFDLVLMRYLIHHIDDKFGAIQEAYRILSPNGRLIIETTDPDYLKRELAGTYEAFPRLAKVDLPRWPRIEYLRKITREVGFSDLYSGGATVHNRWISITEYLRKKAESARTGIGDSRWQLLTEEERWAYYKWLVDRLREEYPDGKVQRKWISTLIVATKP